MRRNTLALAVAGAFALPVGVMAQSTVQIYGNVRVTVENVDSGVANVGGSRMRVTNPGGSLIGFRGTEALGGGLSAFWQIESNIGGADGTRQDVSTLGTRNTGVGLTGTWGRVILGHWDSPYKNFAGMFQPFGATALGGTNSIMNNGDSTGAAPLGIRSPGAQAITISTGTGTSASIVGTSASVTNAITTQLAAPNQNSFHKRWANTVQYRGAFSGFNVQFAYQAPEGEQGQTSPDAWSTALYYAAGPLTVGGTYTRQNSFASAVIGGVLQDTTDDAWMLGVKYTFGGFEVGLGYERLSYDVAGAGPTGNVGDLESKRWQLHGQYRFGPHRVGAMYIKADDSSGTAGTIAAPVARGSVIGNGGAGNTGANQWTLMYGYSFSKRTEVTLAAARISNDAQSAYDFSTTTTGTAVPGVGNGGATRKGYGVTLWHAF